MTLRSATSTLVALVLLAASMAACGDDTSETVGRSDTTAAPDTTASGEADEPATEDSADPATATGEDATADLDTSASMLLHVPAPIEFVDTVGTVTTTGLSITELSAPCAALPHESRVAVSVETPAATASVFVAVHTLSGSEIDAIRTALDAECEAVELAGIEGLFATVESGRPSDDRWDFTLESPSGVPARYTVIISDGVVWSVATSGTAANEMADAVLATQTMESWAAGFVAARSQAMGGENLAADPAGVAAFFADADRPSPGMVQAFAAIMDAGIPQRGGTQLAVDFLVMAAACGGDEALSIMLTSIEGPPDDLTRFAYLAGATAVDLRACPSSTADPAAVAELVTGIDAEAGRLLAEFLTVVGG